MLPKGPLYHTKFTTKFLNMGLTPPRLNSVKKNCTIGVGRLPLFARGVLYLPFQTHRLTATRSCYTGQKHSQRASPPWFPSMKLLAISGGHKTQLSRILHNFYAESEWNNRFLCSSDGLDLLSTPLEMVQMAPQSGIGRLLEGSPRYLVGRPTT